MNFLRTFLDSFRQRAVSVRTYVSTLIFGDSSISGDIVHKPFPSDDSLEENESDDEFYDAVYYKWMYRMYLNMTKVVEYRRWSFAEYRAVLTNFELD